MKPDVSGLQEFGCDVWVLDEHWDGKLAPKSIKGKFLGFINRSKLVRYYDIGRKNIKVSCNDVFNENVPMASVPGSHTEGEPGMDQPNAAHNPITIQTDQDQTNQTDQPPPSDRLTIHIPACPLQTTTTTTRPPTSSNNQLALPTGTLTTNCLATWMLKSPPIDHS